MDVAELIELGDSDELLREIDRLCGRQDWSGLLLLRDLCRAATERGKQLWGAAGHAEYRMALEATPEFAAPMVEADPGRFVLGPLAEVVASTHDWESLQAFLPSSPHGVAVAYERVLRGEELNLAGVVEDFGLPLALMSWEPEYALATYKSHELLAPAPPLAVGSAADLEPISIDEVEFINDPGVDALAALVNPWMAGSNGDSRMFCVRGTVAHALSVLKVTRANRISAQDALAQMAWAGASGGAHGVRSGAAAGRSKLWQFLACLSDTDDEWPYIPPALEHYANKAEWWTWNHTDVNQGWVLNIAVELPDDRLAFAVTASDYTSD